MKRMESGFFARGGFLLSMGFAFAAGPSWAATGSRLDFPPLKESSNAVPKTVESLRLPPLPFDSNVSTGAVLEPKAAKPTTSVSSADILSAVGQDKKSPSVLESLSGLRDSSKDKSPSVSESLPDLTKEQAGPGKSAAEIMNSATEAPKGQSALSALAAAVSELPPAETPEPSANGANDHPSPRKTRPPRPTESVAPASGVETDGNIVRVSVFIDVPFEEIKYPEGTAMLRTKNWLRKSFPGLPEQFSVNGRVVENGFDDDDRVYCYRTEYRLADIKELLPKGAESDTDPVVDSISETAPEPVAEPVSEPATETSSEPVAEPAEESVSESVAEPGPGQIIEPSSPEPGAESAAETTPVSDAPASASVSIKEMPADQEPDTMPAQ